MNKRTRNLSFVAALAGAVVAVDLLSGSGSEAVSPEPSSAQKAVAEAPAPVASAGTSPSAGATAGAGLADDTDTKPPPRLSERLLREGASVSVHGSVPMDPFAPPPKLMLATEVLEPMLAQTTPLDVADFLRRRPLAAVLGDGDSARAVVAGEVLREGEVRDGMTLAAIQRRHVVWAGQGLRFAAGLHAAGAVRTTGWTTQDRGAPTPEGADPAAALFDR